MYVCVLGEGKRFVVNYFAIKGFLGGYPDVGTVEDLPWEDHDMRWVLRGPISWKVEDLDCNGGRYSNWVCTDSKGVQDLNCA